LPRNYHHSAF